MPASLYRNGMERAGLGAGVGTVGEERRKRGGGGGGGEKEIIELFFFYFAVTFVVPARKQLCG